jgi:hypothetical protein
MAEPAPARRETATAVPITVTWSQSNGYGVNPINSNLPASDPVQFICARACWIWTWVNGVLVNAFNGETNYYLPCSAGGNNLFTSSESVGTIITFEATDPDSTPPPPSTKPSAEAVVTGVKGTIKITSLQPK